MDALPVEILDLIFNYCNSSSLCSLRSVCRSLDNMSAQRLWSSITVEPSTQVMRCFLGILNSDKLRKHVRKVTYTTSVDDLEGAECRIALDSVHRFENLESIHVYFDASEHLDMSLIFSKYWLGHVLGRPGFQLAFLSILLGQLYDPTFTTRPRLKSLSICNLTNVIQNLAVSSPHLKLCLDQISELRLKLWTTISGSCLPLEQFFTSLHRDLLVPMAENLTSLTLYGNILWQYVPRTKFLTEAAHFSRLKRLEIGNFPITHEYQVDWILSHTTLEELVMNDCRITHYMSFGKVLDSEGYVMPFPETGDPIYQNPLRWNSIFRDIETRLPHLTVFRFASGSSVNFEDGLILENGLFLDRYMAFTRPWIDWAHRDVIEDVQCVWPQENAEMVVEEDKAYRHLMAVVKTRREKWLISRHL